MSAFSKGTKANLAEKVHIARESFHEVLASDVHEDNKAPRILTAMAFIATAAAVIFAEISRAGIAPSLMFPLFNYMYIPTCFFAFIVTMLIGTLLLLAALGPTFNIPRPKNSKEEPYPRSLLFSQYILEGTPDQWKAHWEESCKNNLEAELVANYVNEAYLLSRKVTHKVNMMRIAKFVYKFSLGFLGLLIVPVLTTDTNQVYSIAGWIFAIVLLQDLVEREISPGKKPFSINSPITLVEMVISIFLVINGIFNWIG